MYLPILKRSKVKRCNEHRLMFLTSHEVLKLFLKTMHQGLCTEIEEFLADSQFGFSRSFGTRDSLFSV